MSVNRYGLDVSYVKRKLKLLLRDIENYTPDEMARELQRLSGAVRPAPEESKRTGTFLNTHTRKFEVWEEGKLLIAYTPMEAAE